MHPNALSVASNLVCIKIWNAKSLGKWCGSNYFRKVKHMKLSTLFCFVIILTACSQASSDRGDASLQPTRTSATLYTNEAYGQSPTMKAVTDPAEYYAKRIIAKDLVFDQKWSEAAPLLESLVAQYSDDGDVWYMLGITYMRTENWHDAIPALENTITLGTILSGVPTGSAPSNDIMLLIAESYAALGDASNATLWAEKSLAARYDDRPFMARKSHFKEALSPDEYQNILGGALEANLSRDEAWRADLAHLADEIRRLHVNFDNVISKHEFNQHIAEIDTKIPSLTEQEIVFEFMKLVGRMGSGHNIIIPTNGAKGSFSRLPVEFYWFSDGLYIIDANEGFEQYIGSEVTSIGGVPIVEALNKTAIINARDNEMQHLWLSPYYVSLPEVLKGLSIVDDAATVSLTMTNTDGVTKDVNFSGTEWSFQGFPKLPKQRHTDLPLYLKNSGQLFWVEAIPEKNTIFVQFNWVNERDGNTLADFSQRLTKLVEASNLDNLIIDLRHNPGGNGSILPSLTRALIHAETAKPDGKLFIISGRGTYSAAHNLLTDLNRLTNAVIVGEPSGSRPNAISEAGWFKLPNSGLTGLVSTQFHQTSKAEDHRIWIAPHIPTSLSSAEYFAGIDPSLEAIFEVIANSANNQ